MSTRCSLPFPTSASCASSWGLPRLASRSHSRLTPHRSCCCSRPGTLRLSLPSCSCPGHRSATSCSGRPSSMLSRPPASVADLADGRRLSPASGGVLDRRTGARARDEDQPPDHRRPMTTDELRAGYDSRSPRFKRDRRPPRRRPTTVRRSGRLGRLPPISATAIADPKYHPPRPVDRPASGRRVFIDLIADRSPEAWSQAACGRPGLGGLTCSLR